MKKTIFDYSSIEKIIKVSFKNKKLLFTAFTHSSYANENKIESNERLEFLGDSVLQYTVTMKLYNDYSLAEGELTKFRQKLVSEEPLAFIIEELGLDKYILKGKGEARNKFDSKSIKADLFESIVGAICLDQGVEIASEFVLKNLESVFKICEKNQDFDDPKTKLQEKFVGESVVYLTKKVDMVGYFEYVTELKINGVICGTGKGHNKKSAERMAAQEALKNTQNK